MHFIARSNALTSLFVVAAFITNVPKCFGQDTLQYNNLESSWCPESWHLYKTHKKSNKGIYSFRFACDDGSFCFQNGVFSEDKKKITFGPANSFCFQRYLESRNKDSIAGILVDTSRIAAQVYLKRGDTLIGEDKKHYYIIKK